MVQDSKTAADADAFSGELKGEGPTLEWRGSSFTLPAGLPAIVVFEAMRLQREIGGEAAVPPEAVRNMLVDLYGETLFVRILRETRTPIDELGDLMRATLAAYDYNTPPPNRAARRGAGRAR